MNEQQILRESLPAKFALANETRVSDAPDLPDYDKYEHFWVSECSQRFKTTYSTKMGHSFHVKLFMSMFAEGRRELCHHDKDKQLTWEPIMPIASSNYDKLHEHSKSITMPCRHWGLHDKDGYVE